MFSESKGDFWSAVFSVRTPMLMNLSQELLEKMEHSLPGNNERSLRNCERIGLRTESPGRQNVLFCFRRIDPLQRRFFVAEEFLQVSV